MSERLTWTQAAWRDYLYWQTQDKKTLKRVTILLQDAVRTPFTALGKPEPLRENLAGFWSRRINESNRLVYTVDGNDLVVIACRYHYD